MILFTVGTSEPFDRLIAVADDVAVSSGEHVLVQGGRSKRRLEVAAFESFMPYAELSEAVAAARLVVTHAGVGSVLLALSKGKVPIVVPRRQRFGEAVDDHQLAFARRISALGLARVIEDTTELPAVVTRCHHEAPSSEGGPPSLAVALREHLADSLGPAKPSGGPA